MSPLLWPVLGAVRFFLALIVAGTHLTWFTPRSPIAAELNRLSALVAVGGFLMISGFSIAASYLRQPAGFYGRRALRIVPLYLLAIAAGVFCLAPAHGTLALPDGTVFQTPPPGLVLQNLFFLQSFTAPSIATNGVVWSLSLEVLFYLLTPLIARCSQTCLALIAGASLFFFVAASHFVLPQFPAMQDGLAFALLGWCWLAGFIVFRHGHNLEAALVLLAVALVAINSYAIYLSLNWPVTLAVVALALGFGPRLRGPRRLADLLTLFGDASYPLYLLHLPLFFLLVALKLPLSGLGLLGAAVLLSLILDKLYDQPIKQLVRRLGARSSRSPRDTAR